MLKVCLAYLLHRWKVGDLKLDIIRIHHSDTIEDMMRQSKDVENLVLARGLRYHLEDRSSSTATRPSSSSSPSRNVT